MSKWLSSSRTNVVPSPPAAATTPPAAAAAASQQGESLLSLIRKLDPTTMSQLVKMEQELYELKKGISSSSKHNFQLETDIGVLDRKIELLIKNRTTLEDVLKAKGDIVNLKEKVVQLKNSQEIEMYGRLFWLLQRKTRYISKIAPLIKLVEIDNLLQTVMFTLYGNQYEEEEEHLLLSMFQSVLKQEFSVADGIPNLLRANTALTRMLATYTRREPGQQYLKNTLTPLLAKVVTNDGLNLEINPTKVFEAYVNEYESKEGKAFTEERNLTAEQCAAHPKVQEIIAPRLKLIDGTIDHFVAVIENSLDQVPYGVRWITRQILSLVKEQFPDAPRAQMCSVVGGFFLLRFVNPAVVTPTAFMLVDAKLSNIAKRNLTVIAKVLQNVANNVSFGGLKEFFMEPLNSMLERCTPRMNNFLERLTEVEDLNEHLAMDRYTELGKSHEITITITLNEMYFVHNLFLQYLDGVAPDEKDPLRMLLQKAGPAPPQLPRKENANVELRLISSKEGQKSQLRPAQIYAEAKLQLFEVIRSVPKDLDLVDGDVTSLLDQIYRAAHAGGKKNRDLVDLLKRLIGTTKKLADMGIDSESAIYERMRRELSGEILHADARLKKVAADISKLKQVEKALEEYNVFANQQLQAYEAYMKNVRTSTSTSIGTGRDKSKRKKEHVTGPFKFSHHTLTREGIIKHSEVPEDKRAHITLEFTSPSPGLFTVHICYRGKSGAEIKLSIDDLLERQATSQQVLETEYMSFSVNLLIYLLNKNFLLGR
eukprot:TRINITY_DN3658_c0_g1_i4.p1 TRINITY_DN3658_c0_g1~~TRINITY_DN3658_c0_g1_i4.p1  ORF type:complete len:766 (-),score=261.93 TRINITY_DN3658_c0_g1_i4:91-2388(-)